MSDTIESGAVRPDILSAFHMMWDLHPAPVMLVRADRTILAVNATGKAVGIPVGSKCFNLNKLDKVCPGCKGNQALRDGVATRSLTYSPGMRCFLDGYWTPLAGEKGLYLHYGNDITECVREELLTADCGC